MRREVARRAKHRCEYCQLQEDFCPEQFEIDHILPRALEGPTTLENLCLACPLCNGAKRSRILAEDPVTGRRVPVFSPRAQKWIQHFRWSEDFGRISGRTPVGRATVAALQMNRPRVVQLRLLWAAMGLHPPRG
jgi:5-methylcytosine-specific restriction endonuclease McrA